MSIDLSKMPKLGFGLMRLPEKDGKYHGGTSEVAVKSALVERYPRESFMLATKLPAWEIKHLGFSFHDTPELLVKILDRHP